VAGCQEVKIVKKRLFYVLAGSLLLAACSSSDSNDPPATGNLPATADVVTVGPVTGFGSIHSNGIHFGTNSATVMMDGESAILSDLKVGMMVSIHGTVNQATGAAEARQIRFMDDAEGPITAMNRVTNRFEVLGQTVLFDELTVVDGATLDTLANGNMVQVSGQWRSQERIQATHIEYKANAYADGMKMEVKGQISGLDPGTQHFYIGTQLCNYAGATLDPGGTALADGMYVEVSSNSSMANGDMLLDRIQLHDRDRDRDRTCSTDCNFELEGFVTSFTSATEFEVDGQPVTTTASTTYVNGTVDTLAIDVRLAVNGTLDTNGVLVADQIVFRLPSLIEIEADVEAINATENSFTLLGINVTTDEFTLFRDHSAIDAPVFGFEDLAVGARVEVRAYLDGVNVIATRVERDDADDTVTLMAPVEAIAQPSLTLLGMTVTSDQDTVFQNFVQEVIDADAFFSLVVIDDLVRAEGTYDGTSILADQLFLRECESSCL
jgi:hypothetical protein